MKSVNQQNPDLSPEVRATLDFVLKTAALLFRQRATANSLALPDPQARAYGAEDHADPQGQQLAR
ncbi:hypothetical protein HNP55_002062 [Paucibacter oligotrophus]|uniref:Uncharacterized protein n=1 Tax=Roseateles oligotrophus TaxID=1769250 RepID=A0A840LBR4_9BURK|nr:hypothetical protein [Roseateles oligotrophus]MBB4843539.1 hypothetical protein [Roseateles oligotrophus]